MLGENEKFHANVSDDKSNVASIKTCFSISTPDPVIESVLLQEQVP